MKASTPPKPRLFLFATDIVDMTGYKHRNARNILSHVRAELGLSSHQAISIYAFSKVFSVPADILFMYINMTDFKTLPITREDLSALEFEDLKALSRHIKFLTSGEFDGIINQPRIPKDNATASDQD